MALPGWLLLVIIAVIAWCIDQYVSLPPPLHIVAKVVWIVCGVLGGVLLLIVVLALAGIHLPG